MDYWKKDFKGVHVIKHKGANVAPWNVGNYKIVLRNKQVFVDDKPLVFYHFASLKLIDRSYYTTISSYLSFVNKEIVDFIYRPYILSLTQLGFVPRVSIRINKNFVVKRLRKMIRSFYKDFIIMDNLHL